MESSAWLLNFGQGELGAVGLREVLHLVPRPETTRIPRTPRHCSQVLIWQDLVVPVWDVLAWLRPGAQAQEARLVAIVGYQEHPGAMPRFGALQLVEPPTRVVVCDSLACEPPADKPHLEELAIACFHLGNKPVPVLDLPVIFSGAFASQGDC